MSSVETIRSSCNTHCGGLNKPSVSASRQGAALLSYTHLTHVGSVVPIYVELSISL